MEKPAVWRPSRRMMTTRGAGALLAAAAAIGTARAAPGTATTTLVMLGDSLTAGLGLSRGQTIPARLEATLRARGIAVRIINAGASGETSADVRARVDFSTPDGVAGALVAIGGNDMLQGIAPEQVRANLDAILARLAARRIKAAVAGMRASANLGAAYGRAFEAAFVEVARARGAPLYPFLLEGVALDPKLNQADGIHPNAAGADIVAGRLAGFVTRAFALG